MNANVTKTNRGKLLAAVLAIMMVFTGVAVIAGDNGVDAATWNMDGDINADQPIRAGTDAVATGPFNITNNSELTIESGASFVINEGVKVTVKSGSTLTIMSGAAVEINGTLVIEDDATLQNGANYDGVNTVSKHYTGVVVNGTIEAERGAVITGAPVESVTNTGSGISGLSVIVDGRFVSNFSGNVTGTSTDNNYVVDVKGTGTIPTHLNGNGDSGAWMALRVGSPILSNVTAGDSVDITINGRASDSDDKVLTGGYVDIWLNAGSVYNVVLKVNDTTYTFKIDTTQVTTDRNYTGGVSGTIVLGADGVLKTSSSNNTKSTFEHQTVLMNVGATANINSLTNDVDVRAIPATDRYPYTYGEVSINADKTGATEVVNLTFGVTSEKISSAFTDEGDENKTSRATNYILTISGDVDGANALRVVPTTPVNGQTGTLYYPDENDEKSDIEMAGIVAIDGTLDISGKGATFSIANGAIVNVNGTLNVKGGNNNTELATIYLSGIVNVSGTIDIENAAPIGSGASADTDKRVNFYTYGVGYLNIIDAGKVTIDGFSVEALASGTNGSSISDKMAGINGAAYETDDGVFIMGLQAAMDAAIAAKEDTVHVFGYDAGTRVFATPYVISADTTIPDDMTICIDGIVSVAEGVTLTISVDAEIDTDGKGLIDVAGTVMDYSMYEFGDSAAEDYASVADGNIKIKAEVRSTDADDTYFMYTTLKNALAGTAGTVELYGNVEVEGTLTIPTGFTVELSGHDMLIKNDATLVIDGVVDSTDAGSSITVTNKDGNKEAGKVTLNNMIVNPNVVDTTTPVANDYVIGGFTANGTIGDYENVDFVLAPAVAAANASTLNDITAVGKFSYSGELVFTAGEDNEGDVITIDAGKTDNKANEITIGTITLNGFGITLKSGAFTGTVQVPVTAGTSAVEFTKAVGYTISTAEDDSGEEIVTEAVIGQLTATGTQEVGGAVTIAAGTVQLGTTATFGGTTKDNTLTIAEGATLVVPDEKGITIESMSYNAAEKDEYAVVTVDGTLTIEEGGIFTYTAGSATIGDKDNQPYYNAIVRINGTMNVASPVTVQSNVYVDGTLNVLTEGDDNGKVTVPAGARVFVNGAINGAVEISTKTGFIYAYPEATVDTANLNLQDDGTTTASATAVYINGGLYMTVYGLDEVVIVNALPTDEFDVPGYEDVVWPDNDDKTEDTVWYSDAEYQNEIDITKDYLEDATAIYAKLDPLNATVQVSVGQGISLYVDGVRVDGLQYLPYNQSTVGDHTVEYTIDPGYKGEATITFAGQTVTNGGTITITPEMTSSTADALVLSVSGNITQDSTVVVDGGDNGSGMGLTDYLLIVLVVLIVIMAIMVAMRLMRS
ncbi:hypothetical protein JS82_06100 [Methanomassiliicoccaceae archaeon DOK]|nr:hypothetical protein JS82_06100 [Methanomassiliicoccaceae archaeon DOK]